MWHELLLLISMSSYLRHILGRIFGKPERRRKSMSLGSEWSYSGELGPENWHKNFPVAASEHQSPVNIDTHDVIYDPYLGEINFSGYHSIDASLKYQLRNTGYAAKVDLHGDMQLLDDDNCYEAYSLVFHWGGEDDRGSEHTIDMMKFPLEIQIMHRNVKYGVDDEEVLYKLDGIKALAFFAEIGEDDHEGLKCITDRLEGIKHKGQEIEIKGFPLASLLPLAINKYYKYSGSLTEPPCNECVNWTVIQDTIKMSKKQLEKFRSLKKSEASATEQEDLKDNFRPVQSIYKRRVTASLQFQDKFDLQI